MTRNSERPKTSLGGVVKQAHAVHKVRRQFIDLRGSRRIPLPTPAPPLLPSELITPPGATRYERTRDYMLRGLQHKIFVWLAVVWLVVLAADFLFYACTLLGLHTIEPDETAQWWNNASVKLLSALFTYVCVIALPWRLANALHLCDRRFAEGVDFYGRPTEDIWFHIPRGGRVVLVLLLWGNASIQILHQVFHILWNTYEAGAAMPAFALLPLTMVLSASCGFLAAVYQWLLESRLHAAHPERFKPGPIECAREIRRRHQAGASLPSAIKGGLKACGSNGSKDELQGEDSGKAVSTLASAVKSSRVQPADAG